MTIKSVDGSSAMIDADLVPLSLSKATSPKADPGSVHRPNMDRSHNNDGLPADYQQQHAALRLHIQTGRIIITYTAPHYSQAEFTHIFERKQLPTRQTHHVNCGQL